MLRTLSTYHTISKTQLPVKTTPIHLILMTNAFEKVEIFQLSKYVRRRVKAAAFVPAVRNGRVVVLMYERVDARKTRS